MACTSCTEKETYFQLVKYPVQAAAQMNNKLLTAQLARHGKLIGRIVTGRMTV